MSFQPRRGRAVPTTIAVLVIPLVGALALLVVLFIRLGSATDEAVTALESVGTDSRNALRAPAALQLARAEEAQRRSRRLIRAATVAGGVAMVLVLVLAAIGAWWLRVRALRPFVALTEVARRFAAGERGMRVAEEGPLELREAARRFNEMAAELSAQRERQTAFLAGVAHDLREPLQGLRIAVGTVAVDACGLPAERRLQDCTRLALRQIARLDRMIDDLLSTTLIEAGQLELHLEPHDLRQIAINSVELFRATLREHELTLSVPREPARAPCDAARIEQAFGNLISNAVKYSPVGSRVDASVVVTASDVEVSVTDQGLGIPLEEQERVFEPFRRGEAIRRSSMPGTGLGLFIAKRIVEAHGGSLHMRSAPGQGSTFTMRLPREPDPLPGRDRPLDPLGNSSGSGASFPAAGPLRRPLRRRALAAFARAGRA